VAARPRPKAGVGRLVEKKGFAHLLEATALLRERGMAAHVVIGGDGPLRDQLESRIRELGLDGLVELPGVLEPDAVRSLLERAAVFAMPCVVAGDGDRDAMPVVVKEALSMEAPVVASDEVGLPEVVRPEWGRLVPPGDVEALAAAIDELLSLSPTERARMGSAGRAFVLDRFSLHREATKLTGLLVEEERPR
jgi:colanic acid/amylovoran biosynthesis glycosyltransferase